MKLYQKSSAGKIKFLDIKTEGDKLIREWGLLGGKVQKTEKVCKPMNKGKANELTAKQQAIAEMKAKITLKKKEGYTEKIPDASSRATDQSIDLDKIPSNFCPDKPISECPDSILWSKDTFAQRKHDGHCVILVKGRKTSRIYSRRMEDITSQCIGLPFLNNQLSALSTGDFVLTEVTYLDTKSGKEIPRFVAQVIRNEDPGESLARYTELSKNGVFTCHPFDILFHKHVFVGHGDYEKERYPMLKSLKLTDIPDLLPWEGPDSTLVKHALAQNWEGFVLRTRDARSRVGFSMDGKAHRHGSYKFKFTKTGDFVIDEALYGKSGKHSQFVSKFHIIEYDAQGGVIDRGYVGPGKLSHDELSELTKELKSGKRRIPFVVEIEYQSMHDDTGKLEFGIIQGIRDDKSPSECIADE